jgi:excisionase family DNA binding protein
MLPQHQALPPSQCPHPLGTELYTTTQVAQALHLSVRTILRAIKSGKLTARRTGKQFLITQDAVQAYWDRMPLAVPEHAATDEQLSHLPVGPPRV